MMKISLSLTIGVVKMRNTLDDLCREHKGIKSAAAQLLFTGLMEEKLVPGK